MRLEGLSEQERLAVANILKEYANDGKSESFDSLINEDWDEIPVSIHTFLHDKKYLGNALYDSEGRFTLFPYWENFLENVFPDNISTKYNTVILSGGIGLGKTLVAVIIMLYSLYRLLCLKNPYQYYGLQEIDKITISMINITLDAAKGVGFDKMNQMILSSEWFMNHGVMRGETNLEYTPNKHIELVAASSNNQIIGRALFCLDGNTKIATIDGDKKLSDCVNKPIKVVTFNPKGWVCYSKECTVKPTIITNEEYQIELSNGDIIKCTPEHRFMLSDGSYKAAKDLVIEDELAQISIVDRIKITCIKYVTLDEPKQFYDVIEAAPYHNFAIKTGKSMIFSHNCNFTDEANFSAVTSNVEAAKAKQLKLISQVDARMKSRFMRGTYLPTINIIASSKNSEQSFLDCYIETKRKNESKNTVIVDEPQWVVDVRKDSKKHFFVAIGNKYMASELLPLDAPESLVDEYRAKGYSMISVPEGYYESFQDNLDGALCDIAGIATASGLKYISGAKWNAIKTNNYQNPFSSEIIEVGTKDTLQYSDFFDLSKIPADLKSKPLYIHLDMSTGSKGVGDKTGIAGIFAVGKRPKVEGEASSKEMYYKLGFHVSVKAPKGYDISFDKNRAFIRWLKQQGFKVKAVSADSFQSSQIKQQLEADGFNVLNISVDRLDPETKVQLQYAYLQSTIYDGRLEIYNKCDHLTNEIVSLERKSDGHIDHPSEGCFTGDTKVSLVDGRELTMLELIDEHRKGKNNFVYSFNETTKRIEPKLIENAWCTIKNAELVEVVLDSGEIIKCTPNHKFMLRDGSYKYAKDLNSGESLMPLYRKYPTEVVSMKNYRMYYEPIEDAWHYEHRQFATEVLDDRYLVHHKNFIKEDNSPTNLVWCSKKKHTELHSKSSTSAFSTEANAKRKISLSKYYANPDNSESLKIRGNKISETIKLRHPEAREKEKLAKERISTIEAMFEVNWDELSVSDRNSYSTKYSRATDASIQEKITAAISKNHADGKYTNAYIALYNSNSESRRLKELCPTVDYDRFIQIFGFDLRDLPGGKHAAWVTKYRKIVCKDILNHKVVTVKYISEKQDVYDITVADNHNFALSCGVFVHNSKDASDAVCGALWSASLHADEFAFEYGEMFQAADINDSNDNFNFEDDMLKSRGIIYVGNPGQNIIENFVPFEDGIVYW